MIQRITLHGLFFIVAAGCSGASNVSNLDMSYAFADMANAADMRGADMASAVDMSSPGATDLSFAPDLMPATVTWSEQAYLKAADNTPQLGFGIQVAIDGDTIVVGGAGDNSSQTTITNGSTASSDTNATGSGAAFVYKRTANNWAQEAYLKASNGDAMDALGSAVAISGDTIVVGATGEDSSQTTITNGSTASSDNSASNSGAAYVFVRSGSAWSQESYLKPNGGVSELFGASVAIDGDTIVVGSPFNSESGSIYVFTRSGSTWSQQAYLESSNGDTNDAFGNSLAIAGDTMVVSAQYESSNQTSITNGTSASSDNSAQHSGAAYVFVRTGTTWTQQAYLKAANAAAGARFGFTRAVGIYANTIVVGAPGESSNQTAITNGTTASSDTSASGAGAAYVYVRSGSNWSQQAYLKASNAQATSEFGSSVAILEDTIVVGAYGEPSAQTTITNGASALSDNSTPYAGAAYVFVRSGTAWSEQAYLKAPNAAYDGSYGNSVSISGNTIVIGAADESSNQSTITNGPGASSDNSAGLAGAAYVVTGN